MRRQEILNRISVCLARFVAEVKGATATRFTDINKHSEEVLVPLFREVFELPNLYNLNTTETPDFPAIDLADDVARVAFQITASPRREKVVDTLDTFLRHNLQARYDRLVIYVLTERQREYATTGISNLIAGRMAFCCEKDIVDWRYVLKVLAGRPTESLERACAILEKQFGGRKLGSSADPLDQLELLPNLVEVYRRRDSYQELEYAQLERLVRESLLRNFPLLYWCGKYKGDVLAALESLFTHEGFPCRSGACHLWVLLQDNPVEMHVERMNRLRLGRTLDSLDKIIRAASRAKREEYASRGMHACEIVEAMASCLGEPTVRELSAFARHPDKIVRRTLAFWLHEQHNFAAVDLLVRLL